MGTKYTSQSTSGYNASPPSDDGTAVSSNEVKWSFIKTKLADVLKTFGEGINTAILTHTDESVLDKGVTYTTTAADHKRTINVTAAATQSLGDAATMAAGYIVTIKNSHSAAITVDLATGADTLDGTAAGSLSLEPDEAVTVGTNDTPDGYLIESRSLDIESRESAQAGLLAPTGSVTMWTTASAPTGWNECDGSSQLRTGAWADLFAVIGVTYGNVDGTHFNLPDLRGQFVRGFDNTAGNDPDAASRTDRGDGTTGDNVGTRQDHELDAHTHTFASAVTRTSTAAANTSLEVGTGRVTESTGGNETRPVNVNLMYIIKL